jgi:hypothetical protein
VSYGGAGRDPRELPPKGFRIGDICVPDPHIDTIKVKAATFIEPKAARYRPTSCALFLGTMNPRSRRLESMMRGAAASQPICSTDMLMDRRSDARRDRRGGFGFGIYRSRRSVKHAATTCLGSFQHAGREAAAPTGGGRTFPRRRACAFDGPARQSSTSRQCRLALVTQSPAFSLGRLDHQSDNRRNLLTRLSRLALPFADSGGLQRQKSEAHQWWAISNRLQCRPSIFFIDERQRLWALPGFDRLD